MRLITASGFANLAYSSSVHVGGSWRNGTGWDDANVKQRRVNTLHRTTTKTNFFLVIVLGALVWSCVCVDRSRGGYVWATYTTK